MRASRLLSILLLLQARGRTTAGDLAAELEVSVRTVYRDVEALAAAGVPVYAERGPAGGFALVDGYRTRLTGLSGDEADALFLSGLPGPAAELGLGAATAAAELKLLAALSPASRRRAETFRDRFHLDVAGWWRPGDRVPMLTEVAAAVWAGRVVDLRYVAWDTEVERRLEPLGLVLKAGAWYLVARPPGGEPRTYRVARIRALRVGDERFARGDDFDLAGFWARASRRYERGVYGGEAVLRLAPAARRRLPGWWGALAADAAAASESAPDAAGWVTVTVPIESVDDAARQVLRFVADCEVLGPPELRARVGEHVAALAAGYAVTPAGPGPDRRAGDGGS